MRGKLCRFWVLCLLGGEPSARAIPGGENTKIRTTTQDTSREHTCAHQEVCYHPDVLGLLLMGPAAPPLGPSG